ncbi:hypothetical protein GS440_03600 [Rhodococcus hoagii]|nr:hypothetical protein [Prescottella equi]
MKPINTDMVYIALDKAEGTSFEKFTNIFMPAVIGYGFKPLGGVKDGGADGLEEPIHERDGSTTTFYQASVQKNFEDKIRSTVTRIRDFGRDPRVVHMVTSNEIKYLDQMEESLGSELEVTIRIRDAKYIASHINSSSQTVAAYNEHLRHYTDFLSTPGSSRLIGHSKHVMNPEVYVFLSQEMDRREGIGATLDGVVDSLILWSLQGTDPDNGILCDESEILERIEGTLPSVQSLVSPKLRPRLMSLSTGTKSDRKVRWHQQVDKFCLPWESRRFIEDDNREDETIRINMARSIADRIEATGPDLTDRRKGLCKGLVQSTIETIFEREGLMFSSFLESRTFQEGRIAVTDALRDNLDNMTEVRRDERAAIGDCAFTVLRGVLHESTDSEREYLKRLTRTYSLLFTLNRQPNLLEYFEHAAGDYYLYVGADQLVLALSERFLPEADKSVTNTLLAAGKAGATLILTEHVVSEVVHNLRTSDIEYQNSFSSAPGPVPFDIARNCPKILVRAFLYAQLERDRLGTSWPRNWQNYVSRFCTHNLLRSPAAFDYVRRYLQAQFSLEYRSTSELEDLVDIEQLDQLTADLVDTKNGRHDLAKNDALMALAVYGHRTKRREDSSNSEFGYRTWWLTNESRIISRTRDLVRRYHGSRYIMRPEFLLNFLALSPAASTVRKEFGTIFPSHIGMSLSRKMPEATYKELIEKIQDSADMDEAQRSAAMAHCADRMRSDFQKQYDSAMSRGLDDIAEELLN